MWSLLEAVHRGARSICELRRVVRALAPNRILVDQASSFHFLVYDFEPPLLSFVYLSDS